MALGYIRREVGAPGREVTIGGVKATVVQLPVTDAALAQKKALWNSILRNNRFWTATVAAF